MASLAIWQHPRRSSRTVASSRMPSFLLQADARASAFAFASRCEHSHASRCVRTRAYGCTWAKECTCVWQKDTPDFG
eukprot:6179208-Pleurochrysis_carterae.AAC.5